MNPISISHFARTSPSGKVRAPGRSRRAAGLSIGLAAGALLLAGCTAPIGADRVTPREAYEQVEANALRTGKPSANTVAILHRQNLDRLAERHPDEAVRQLHQIALNTGERDLLFALAEMSYVAAGQIQRSVKPWDARDAREFYLGAAVYAWLFLFGDVAQPPPGAFDRRFREACDLYNYGLGQALIGRKGTNSVVELAGGRRRLPVGEIELRVDPTKLTTPLGNFEQILLADQYRVRGLSVRNRQPGLGATLICVSPVNPEFKLRQAAPATAFLRGPASLAALTTANTTSSLEVYPAFDGATVTVEGASVPLEFDLTTFRAYTLNQSTIWKLGPLQFLAPAERIASRLIQNQPYEPGKIPVVFVHGTFSSPVTWAEMANTLVADPELRRRYQIWTFLYGSGNPLAQSIAEFRAALTAEVQRIDPAGTNATLRQMVIIGHSQGGLLTKSTAVHTGDRIWRVFSTNRLEDLQISDAQRGELRRLTFYEPLPFVRRVVFIATPHRGSYQLSGFVRGLGHRLVSLPSTLMARSSDVLRLTAGSEAGDFFQGKMPTSLDGMSPRNPGLMAMSEIPVAPSIKAHSIIPVKGDGDPADGGKDGIVSYESAHIEPVESEFIVRWKHTCLDHPATIQEVRRILQLHLNEPAAPSAPHEASPGSP